MSVHVACPRTGEPKLKGTMGPGSEFGSPALIRPVLRQGTVTATSAGAELAALEVRRLFAIGPARNERVCKSC